MQKVQKVHKVQDGVRENLENVVNSVNPEPREPPEPCEPRELYTLDSLCPSLCFFVVRYLRVESVAGISSGSHSLTERP